MLSLSLTHSISHSLTSIGNNTPSTTQRNPERNMKNQETSSLNKPNETSIIKKPKDPKRIKNKNQETHPMIQRETSTNLVATTLSRHHLGSIAAASWILHCCHLSSFFFLSSWFRFCSSCVFVFVDFYFFIIFGFQDFWLSEIQSVTEKVWIRNQVCKAQFQFK